MRRSPGRRGTPPASARLASESAQPLVERGVQLLGRDGRRRDGYVVLAGAHGDPEERLVTVGACHRPDHQHAVPRGCRCVLRVPCHAPHPSVEPSESASTSFHERRPSCHGTVTMRGVQWSTSAHLRSTGGGDHHAQGTDFHRSRHGDRRAASRQGDSLVREQQLGRHQRDQLVDGIQRREPLLARDQLRRPVRLRQPALITQGRGLGQVATPPWSGPAFR